MLLGCWPCSSPGACCNPSPPILEQLVQWQLRGSCGPGGGSQERSTSLALPFLAPIKALISNTAPWWQRVISDSVITYTNYHSPPFIIYQACDFCFTKSFYQVTEGSARPPTSQTRNCKSESVKQLGEQKDKADKSLGVCGSSAQVQADPVLWVALLFYIFQIEGRVRKEGT